MSDQESKKTMMGIPSFDLTSPKDIDKIGEQSSSKSNQTMFGFPADVAPVGVDDSEDSESATEVISGDVVQSFTEHSPFNADDVKSAVRTTSPGGLRALESTQDGEHSGPRSGFGSTRGESKKGGVEDSEADEATAIAPASLFFQGELESKGPLEASRRSPKRHETLMGMTLGDIAGNRAERETMFSMPAPSFGEMSDGLSETSEDVPTQALTSSVVDGLTGTPGIAEQSSRQRLLGKLRSAQQSSQKKEAHAKTRADKSAEARSTMFGIPALSSDVSLGVPGTRSVTTPEPDVEAYEYSSDVSDVTDTKFSRTPTTGVLKKPQRRSSNVGIDTQGPSVLGSTSYLVQGDKLSSEEVLSASLSVPNPNLPFGATSLPEPSRPSIDPFALDDLGGIVHTSGAAIEDNTQVADETQLAGGLFDDVSGVSARSANTRVVDASLQGQMVSSLTEDEGQNQDSSTRVQGNEALSGLLGSHGSSYAADTRAAPSFPIPGLTQNSDPQSASTTLFAGHKHTASGTQTPSSDHPEKLSVLQQPPPGQGRTTVSSGLEQKSSIDPFGETAMEHVDSLKPFLQDSSPSFEVNPHAQAPVLPVHPATHVPDPVMQHVGPVVPPVHRSTSQPSGPSQEPVLDHTPPSSSASQASQSPMPYTGMHQPLATATHPEQEDSLMRQVRLAVGLCSGVLLIVGAVLMNPLVTTGVPMFVGTVSGASGIIACALGLLPLPRFVRLAGFVLIGVVALVCAFFGLGTAVFGGAIVILAGSLVAFLGGCVLPMIMKNL